jgi:phosphatidylglycerophosphate synthase
MLALRSHVPNLLSLSRLPLGIAFLLLYDTTSPERFSTAVGVAALAFLTDVADGRLARRWGVASDAGALIDGIGDKAFYVAVYLVMAHQQAAESLLIWGLIFREVALYALRTIDGDRLRNTKQLRWASLTYAFVIRIYFLYFLAVGTYAVTGRPVPLLVSYGYIFGYLALLFGYIGLAKLIHQMGERG